MKIFLKIVLILLGVLSFFLWLSVFFYLIDFEFEIFGINLNQKVYPIIDSLSSRDGKLDSLSKVGSIFNVITSLTSVFIVWLVATGVYFQKRELDSLKEQIKNQINSSKNEERINRTINEIENWLSIKRNTENNLYSRDYINSLCNSLDWIMSIEKSKIREFLDFELLISTVNEQSTRDLLKDIAENLDGEIDSSRDDEHLQSELKNYQEATSMGAQVWPNREVKNIIRVINLDKRIYTAETFLKKMQKEI